MFRQILIHEDDRDLLRIFWRFGPQEPVREYRLKTVTYGSTCASFQAARVLMQLADDEEPNFPLATQIVRRDFYMDDCLSGEKVSRKPLRPKVS
jgi:hypothetical protein